LTFEVGQTLHLGLILNELITNAAKHASPGQHGEVTVSVRDMGDRLEVRVRDKGVGLPPDFELGQVRSLGLRIVNLLARRLNASVKVESANGAMFTLTVPLRRDTPAEPGNV
jgi:two-component sensor histidine kinase